ncbi:hypothetical protein H2O64_21940 [Kordia sp. YSTF-M3]|uniref:Uncharacterized protein n=1 Tax=Kordia aestuariivivens TaxID=2759037 RepID=A0ABR7QFL3_9FLAO|nr:hypothetical protein [Kordia aestuariivivens]MBC8757346.1 hypothetical protein [Kordia aestuariivivens]
METKDFASRLVNINQLTKDEQLSLRNEILQHSPELLRPWWFKTRCEINVLVVTDGALDFGIGGFGLSNFLTIFKILEAESNTNLQYNVTLGHRGNPGSAGMQSTNPNFVNKITNFKFDDATHFTTSKYDQVWLFGFSTAPIASTEISAIEAYMNKGGGVFATGDHGNIGIGLCGNITRVKDMRHWQDFGGGEVSMGGNRRNDTNTPHSGNPSSISFADQGDAIPQNIHARVYGAAPNLLPHYLLSISTAIKPSGIIDIMPDHPHEGECKPETDFTLVNPNTGNSHTIRSQNIAMSFVTAGNTAGFKAATEPHCFASISVFDGRSASVGRIAIDSTWHHFVNINLDGFAKPTFEIVLQYYKNIARWMTRAKRMLCFYHRCLIYAMFSDRIMEANILDLDIKADAIPDDELYAIGEHVIDVIKSDFTPADALQFKLTMLESVSPELATKIDVWDQERKQEEDFIHNQFVSCKPIIAMAVGLGVARIKDEIGNPKEQIDEKDETVILDVFQRGLQDGIAKSLTLFNKNVTFFSQLQRKKG